MIIDYHDSKIFDREINPLKRVNDNYEKIILTLDKIPKSNDEGIKILNVLDWLLEN